ncbi:uncharacterized protein V1510DRAFT_413189 [Dipodascopsis tothii]|uniref:uncharacterized protein n=1 Tax=Dipodascopsis tothii TaxID=44089 RepID=UPI0034CD3ED5
MTSSSFFLPSHTVPAGTSTFNPSKRALTMHNMPPPLQKIHRELSTRHISYVPLLNVVVIAAFLVMLVRLAFLFPLVFQSSPLVLTMVSNILLYGLADLLAQTVSTVIENVNISRRSSSLGVYGSEKAGPSSSAATVGYPPATLRLERMVRFSCWGLLLSFFLLRWLIFLEVWIPMTPTSVALPVLCRVLADQLVFTPLTLAAFFAFINFAEGGSNKTLYRKMSTLYIPTLKQNFMLWPAVQIFNFRLVPLQYQVPFLSTVGVLWNTWLSLANSASPEV